MFWAQRRYSCIWDPSKLYHYSLTSSLSPAPVSPIKWLVGGGSWNRSGAPSWKCCTPFQKLTFDISVEEKRPHYQLSPFRFALDPPWPHTLSLTLLHKGRMGYFRRVRYIFESESFLEIFLETNKTYWNIVRDFEEWFMLLVLCTHSNEVKVLVCCSLTNSLNLEFSTIKYCLFD